MRPILLDTHVALWAMSRGLPSPVVDLIETAASQSELRLSPVTGWEIGMLFKKRRILLNDTPERFVRELFALPGVVTAVLTPAIAVNAAALPASAGSDPADRLLIATAMSYGAEFVTRDRRIRAFAKTAKTFRCVAC